MPRVMGIRWGVKLMVTSDPAASDKPCRQVVGMQLSSHCTAGQLAWMQRTAQVVACLQSSSSSDPRLAPTRLLGAHKVLRCSRTQKPDWNVSFETMVL